MNILATNKFQEKLTQLDQLYRGRVDGFIHQLKGMESQDAINLIAPGIGMGEISIYKLGNLSIFFNFTDDQQGNSVLVLLDLASDDFIAREVAPLNHHRNPRYNNLINPRYNNLINPRYNNLINPRYNNLINPRYNNLINPRYNNLINPRYNNLINPRYNNLINPRYNNLINPRYNNLINPRYNPGFSGYYHFDLDSTALEFVIPTEDRSILFFFSFEGALTKYAVRHNQNGYVIFTENGEWVSHLESDSQTGFNYFDLNQNWIGFLK